MALWQGTADIMCLVPCAPGVCLLVTVASLCKPWLADQLRLYTSNVSCTIEEHGFAVPQAGCCKVKVQVGEFLGVSQAMSLMSVDLGIS